MEKQIDPRILRTRKLIMDAFIELTKKKDFNDITIGDITSAATVNRATFYNHFFDKHDLLERVLSESVMREVLQEVSKHEVINEETITSIFNSIIKFQISVSNQCQRSFEALAPQIETNFKKELQAFFSERAQRQWSNQIRIEIEIFAVMLSWSLYGAAMHWMHNRSINPEDYVKQILRNIKLG